MSTKKTIITGPNGEVTTISEEKRGCVWWTGTFAVGLFLVGLIIVYPLLLIPTTVIVVLSIIGYVYSRNSKRRTP